ncbi:methylaspartate mutase [Streptomyces griseorubiginosus]|uniref:methylaspartate mutase n=1 Tax=Streptomyces griseorubiginosus TaxID=67304 RepID=UPI001AD7257E|nr:methylaspartate mutase [Streptomyces griseorubiginosus]MBO4254982.1 methylaspartate mutase [Streptomyces griseorubiginosus]
MTRVSFGDFVAGARANGTLVVQPRMGFGDPRRMREGLARTRAADAVTVGTLTLDSYTRVRDLVAARQALDDGVPLNGYPICTHPLETSRAVLNGIHTASFPVQVRHGSARPEHIVAALLALGLEATEGGPVSYCLPYGRTPLQEAVASWRRSCEMLARHTGDGRVPHVESFGGCMLGQLCPPAVLVAVAVLEGLFFTQHGLRSVSLSYAQQTSPEQDLEAVAALRLLAGELLGHVDWHVVLYTYMGVYPLSRGGALALLEAAARLAVASGASRLIVKTAAEAHRIPTIADNVEALETAARAAAEAPAPPRPRPADADSEVYAEARTLVHTVLGLHDDVGTALLTAFRRGLLDIPYCLHPDNAGRARSFIDRDGRLRWADTGALPLPRAAVSAARKVTSADLLAALSHVQRAYDHGGTP